MDKSKRDAHVMALKLVAMNVGQLLYKGGIIDISLRTSFADTNVYLPSVFMRAETFFAYFEDYHFTQSGDYAYTIEDGVQFYTDEVRQ